MIDDFGQQHSLLLSGRK